MTITNDLYKELELDRSWDTNTIKNRLKEMLKQWTMRQSSCNSKEQLLIIDKVLSTIDEAYRNLCKDVKREIYDEALDEAYRKGRIQDKTEEKLQSLIAQARQYYQKGNIKLAMQTANQAIEGHVNDPEAYEILARCYYATNNSKQALNTIDAGMEIFNNNTNLQWLGARIATLGTKNYDDAQQRVNKLIEMAPDASIGHSEQIFLHLHKGDEDLAFKEIDTYIAAHPNDKSFKQGVAYDIDAYSNSCYYYDEAQNATFIADKNSYQKCLMLRNKALSIFNDEHTTEMLNDAKYYGKKEWDSWNSESIKSLSIYGVILTFIFFPIGLILLAIDAAVIFFSFRPYWQINKTYLTGQMGPVEKVVTVLGDYAARFGGWLVRLFVKLFFLIMKFVTGGFFR